MNDVLLGVFVTVAVLMVFNLGSCVGYQEGVRDDRDGVVKCVADNIPTCTRKDVKRG